MKKYLGAAKGNCVHVGGIIEAPHLRGNENAKGTLEARLLMESV